MAKEYAKFEAPKEIVDKSLEALRLAKQSGAVRKGVNEVTKSIERGLAALVLIAGDVEPEEVVMHLPTMCEQKRIPYLFIPAKLDLGKAAGLNVPCTAASIEKAGEGQAQMKEVLAWAVGKSGGSAKQEAAKEKK
jgi:large subunit ribosomal protein L7Ae